MPVKRMITVRCTVLSPDGTDRLDREYKVEQDGEMTVLNVLEYIYHFLDSNIAFYSFCRQGLCGGCLVEVNGNRVLACKTPACDNMHIRPILDRGYLSKGDSSSGSQELF